ncbi:MAG TPA: hypothetical protein VLV16_05375 [Gemmatimonadales bacterium]|nr:hypothetical protein [Gemmatimonadales bacterium]
MRRPALCALLIGCSLACNGGLEPTPAGCPSGFVGICGTVTYRGAVPESTDVIFTVAYETFPTGTADLFKFKPSLPPTIPAGGVPFHYSIPLPAGRYEWVVAVWKKLGTLNPNGSNADTLLRAAGFYRDPTDTSKPGVVVVGTGPTNSIDFVVDFAHMRRVCDLFPCP